MNIAVICLGYMKNAAGAALLAKYFEDLADLYLHIDAKSDIAPYARVKDSHANITLAETRFPIFWGGFNTVRACVTTIEQALRTKDYGRIAFITEDTIPLISRSEFYRRMTSSTEWIQIYPTTNPDWIARYEHFFFFDSYATNPRTTQRLDRAWTPEMLATTKRLEALWEKGKVRIPRLFDGGSWWCLNRDKIDKFISQYHADLHLRESFEFSAIPEEQYIHTILGPILDTKSFVFTDWNRQPRPYVFSSMMEIRNIDTRDTPMLRKVAIGVSEIESFVRELAKS